MIQTNRFGGMEMSDLYYEIYDDEDDQDNDEDNY